MRQALAAVLCLNLADGPIAAQSAIVERPKGSVFLRPYRGATVPPPQLKNNGRLAGFLRAGKLYLTVQDVVALALENNIDLEVARYGPLAAEWNYVRAQAGGALPGVSSGNSVVNQATGGQGVVGSQASAGLLGNGGGNSSGGGGAAAVSQVGPVTANLDPVLQNITALSHTTTPQANTVQSQTSALVDTRRVSNTVVQQGLLTGGYVQLSVNESYLKENAPTNILNPSEAPLGQIYARHNFLRAFGTEVNSRFIRVAALNRNVASQSFRSQVMDLVFTVTNQYWEVVNADEEVKARQASLAVSAKLNRDLADEVRLGAVARFEIFRAEADVKMRQRELDLSIATKRQQDTLLKNLISRDGLADALIDGAEIVPLDSVQIPESDDLLALRELAARAMKNRPDILIDKMNDETRVISALGTANGILPTLQGIASMSASGLAGTPQPQAGGITADPYFIGGAGAAYAQVLRNDFKNRRGAVVFQGTLLNRIAQADYGIEQLELRRSNLESRRSQNQLVVDISNQIIALRQARSRYSVAVDALALQSDLLTKERQKFALGDSTISGVIAAQRSQSNAQSAEIAARAGYNRARLGLQQTLGETLEAHHVSLNDATSGMVPVAPKP